jgi:PAS domain S-box-containing protein
MKTFPVLNLRQRGMIVVAFPIICQLAFVILLGFRLHQIQNYMQSETLSQDIIRRAYSLSNVIINQLIFDYSLVEGGNFISVEEQQKQWFGLKDDVRKFLNLIEKDPLQQQGIKAFNLAMEEMNESILGFKQIFARPDWKILAKRYQNALIAKAPGWTQVIDQIVSVEEAKVTADSAAIERSIAALVGSVGVFAFINIGIALLLGLYFAKMISNPLTRIRNNGKLLSQRQPLLPVMKDAAEFTKLDSLLHATADDLETALKRNKELVENAADIIVSANETGDIISINRSCYKLLGYETETLIGAPMHSLAVPEQSLLADEQFRAAMQSEKPETFELQLGSKSGKTIDTRWSCLWSQPHKKMFCVIHDISEHKRVEQMKEDFANMISHDLRSPLMAMHNSLSLILAGVKGKTSDEVNSDISRAVANLDKLMQLVNDLLDFQKLKAGRMELEREHFDARELARDTNELLGGFAERKGISLELPDKELIVDGDRRMLLQVLTNLVSNAIKFSPDGEKVTISMKAAENGFEFSVGDRGRGIADENLERVFETFEQEARSDEKQGTGLGLAICKLIVEAHGGRIWAESKGKGKGSTFSAFIPEHKDSQPAAH